MTAKKSAASKPVPERETTNKSVLDRAQSNLEQARELNKKLALASLGIVGRILDEVHNNCRRVNARRLSLVDSLVDRGELVQGEAMNLFRHQRTRLRTRVHKTRTSAENFYKKYNLLDRLSEAVDRSDSTIKKA